jgi:type II secretory ATPase GspE/PulE/Tfp pilus assembly ATPase PilB-like protein
VAIEQGMQTMWQDGLRRVIKGQTTLEEILRVIAIDAL